MINWKRVIYLGQPNEEDACGIGQAATRRLVESLEQFRGVSPIYLLFNNDGGFDDEARAIIDIIENVPQDIIGVVFGRAESAAAWIFQKCDKRIMTPRSNLMLHLGSSAKTAHSEWADRIFVEDVLGRLQEKDPGYPRNKLVRELKRDWHVYGDQAVELGLADTVWRPK